MTRTVRLFVSSTVADLRVERDALHEYVFPRLRTLCAGLGWEFHPVDLRWGITDAAALSQLTVDICLAEVERCRNVTRRPNFLLLLGERYGWRPLPPSIPAAEFERLRGDEAASDLLATWYRRDDNAMPTAYVLLPRVGEFGEDHMGTY